MKTGFVTILACPRGCFGKLKWKATWRAVDDDVLEGLLQCETCAAIYPVLCGIAIIRPRPFYFLRSYHSSIFGMCRGLRCLSAPFETELLRLMLDDVASRDEEVFPPQREYSRDLMIEMIAGLGSYLRNHYCPTMENDWHPLGEFVAKHRSRGPHDVLCERVEVDKLPNFVALDIGCCVGGLTRDLAAMGLTCCGVDSSFSNVLIASMILLQRPRPLFRVPMIVEGRRVKWFDLESFIDSNSLEFVCGQAEHLPFSCGVAGVAASCNLIDVVSDPWPVVDEQIRSLARSGMFLLSDPYEFYGDKWKRLGSRARRDPVDIVKEKIRDKILITAEEDMVPWISSSYRRFHSVYYNHCLAGIKK